MRVDVTPSLERRERLALLAALEHAGFVEPKPDIYAQVWRLAGLREGADEEEDVRYAFSPRSTRGATRA